MANPLASPPKNVADPITAIVTGREPRTPNPSGVNEMGTALSVTPEAGLQGGRARS